MKLIILFYGISLLVTNAEANPVRSWWVQCKGNDPESTCLSEAELSKFKTICSNRKLKEDCHSVVDYVIAKTRITEGRTILLNGYSSQLSNYTANKKYSVDIDKIWNPEIFNKMSSFAAGILPSCNLNSKQRLYFGKNLRPEIKDIQNQFLKLYASLASLPCPDNKNGFVLVTIGKVFNSVNEFEIFTVDEKKNIVVIQSGLGAGPFSVKTNQSEN